MQAARTRLRIKGTKIYAQAVSPYDSTSQSLRARHWRWNGAGPNAVINASLQTLRGRSRDLVRRNGIAHAAIEVLTTNVVRYGIKPQWNTPDSGLNKALAKLWRRWCDESDATGRLDFYGQQALAFRSMCEGGDVFARLRTRFPRDGLSVPFQIQLLESEFCPVEKNETASTGGAIQGGIEFDPNLRDKRVAYWMYREHPDDQTMFGRALSVETVRVDARDVAHLANVGRSGGNRGEPLLARAMMKMRDIDIYDDAQVQRQSLGNMFAGFITPAAEGTFPGDETPDGDGIAQSPLEPGTVQVLRPGESITWSEPPEAGATYDAFMRQQMRLIASAAGILYEQLSGDYSQVNDRTWRAAMNEFNCRIERWQHQIVVPQFCVPIMRRWVTLAVLSNSIKLPRGMDVDDISRPKWLPPARPYINPVQDVEAKRAEVRAGFRSRAEIVSESGYDIEDVDDEIAADNARADRLGNVYDTDPRKVASNGAVQSLPAEEAPPVDAQSG